VATTNDLDLRERSIAQLMRQLAEETGILVRQEVQLARAEMQEKLDLIRADLRGRSGTAKDSLSRDTQQLKSELAVKGKRVGVGTGLFAGASVFGIIALAILASLLVRVLDAVMPSWVALTLVLLLYIGTAAGLALAGRDRLRKASPLVPRRGIELIKHDVSRLLQPSDDLAEALPPYPEQTIETLKEDLEWAKHPTRSGTK